MPSLRSFASFAIATVLAAMPVAFTQAADTNSPPVATKANDIVTLDSVLEKLVDEYGDLDTYTAKCLWRIVDAEGKPIPNYPEPMNFDFAYQAPGLISISTDQIKIVVAENAVLLEMKESQNYALFETESPATFDELFQLNPAFGLYLRNLHILALLEGDTSLLANASIEVQHLPGMRIVQIDTKDPLPIRYDVDYEVNLITNSWLQLSEEPKVWSRLQFIEQEFNAELPESTFDPTPPAEFQNVTDILTAPSNQHTSPLLGKAAPDFTLKTLDGKEVTLSSMRGKVVVLDFWALWCKYCLEGMPALNSANQQLDSDKAVLWSLNVDEGEDTPERVSHYFNRKPTSVTQILVPDEHPLKNFFEVEYLPVTYFIDPEGNIGAVHYGLVESPEVILSQVNKMLEKKEE